MRRRYEAPATVTEQVEWEGRMVDVIPGMGGGWEPGLVALELYLRGELPDLPAAEWISQAPASERERLERFGEQGGPGVGRAAGRRPPRRGA